MNPLYFLKLVVGFLLFDLRLATGHAARYDQSEVITVYRLGRQFKASRRTVQHLDWTIKRLKWRYPWARLVILQTCYHTGYAPSAHTHDFDCVFDFQIIGISWLRAQKFLRYAGWVAYWRHTGPWADPHAQHLHCISLPPGLRRGMNAEQVGRAFAAVGIKVGELIDGGWTTRGHIVATSQVVDYLSTPPRDGLADHAIDKTRFPPNIAKTLYHYNDRLAS